MDKGWTTIGRIIAHERSSRQDIAAKEGPKRDLETRYLVKWQGLPYNEASWEWEDELKSFAGSDFDQAMAKFQGLGPIANDATISLSAVILLGPCLLC